MLKGDVQQLTTIELNNGTTPLELREQLSLRSNDIRASLNEKLPGKSILLVTCQRFTIITAGADESMVIKQLQQYFPQLGKANWIVYRQEEAIQRFLSTASGLNSRNIGEHEILGQIKNTYAAAAPLCAELHELMKRAIYTGKRSRTETGIGRHSTSLAGMVAERIKDHFDLLENRNILLFGTGEMAKLVLNTIGFLGAKSVHIASQNLERSEAVCKLPNQQPVLREEAVKNLNSYDIIIGATSASEYLVRKKDIRPSNSHKLLIDLGMPRNFEGACKDEKSVSLYDLETINKAVEHSKMKRNSETDQVSQIVLEETNNLIEWFDFRLHIPQIRNIKRQLQARKELLIDEIENESNFLQEREKVKLTYQLRGLIQRHFSLMIEVFKSGIDDHLIEVYQQDILAKMDYSLKKLLLSSGLAADFDLISRNPTTTYERNVLH